MDSETLVARVGREKQRYEDHFRLVSGCIPYKLIEGDANDLLRRLRVLMISTPNRHDLVFPKGGWEDDETDEEAACREAMEEAGVRGIIRRELGVWKFRSKSKQKICSLEGSCKGSMFALQVTEELSSWPEQKIYERKWLTVEEAWQRCRYDWMREALDKCFVFLTRETESSCCSEKIPEPPSISADLSVSAIGSSKSLSMLSVDGSA